MAETAYQRAQAKWNNGDHGKGGGLPPAGPGGTSGDMEARVKRLEDDSKEIRADLRKLLVDTAVMNERITHLPSKGWGLAMIATLIGIMVGVTTLAPRLQAVFGTATVQNGSASATPRGTLP